MNETITLPIRVGYCCCCGQSVTLKTPAATQGEADAMATMECRCPQGAPARRQADEKKTLQELFPDISQEAGELLCAIPELIRDGHLYGGTSIRVAENVTAKFKMQKGVVIVTRAEKNEHQRSV